MQKSKVGVFVLLCIVQGVKTEWPLTFWHTVSVGFISLSFYKSAVGALFAFHGVRLRLRVRAHPETLLWPVLTVWQVIDQTWRLTRVPLIRKRGIWWSADLFANRNHNTHSFTRMSDVFHPLDKQHGTRPQGTRFPPSPVFPFFTCFFSFACNIFFFWPSTKWATPFVGPPSQIYDMCKTWSRERCQCSQLWSVDNSCFVSSAQWGLKQVGCHPFPFPFCSPPSN